MPRIDARLDELGIRLPDAPKPVAAYVPSVHAQGLIFVSGQIPLKEGSLMATGTVPSETAVDQAVSAARQCAINAWPCSNHPWKVIWIEFEELFE